MVSEPYFSPRGETTPTVPMLAACNPSALQIWRVKAATEVLPLVPVTAAMVPGWRGKNFAAATASARRALLDRHEGDSRGQTVGALLGRDRHCAGRRRGAREMRAVGLGAGDGDEQKAGFDLAAVGGNAGNVDGRKLRDLARIELGFAQELTQPHRVSFALANSN